MDAPRDWHVLLIGGASGVGKSSIAYPLARHVGVGITEIDDFQAVLERMTTPAQYPAVHLFRTDPDAFVRLDGAGKLRHAVAYATVMAEALEPVVANHLDGGSPIVLEGDFLLPAFAARGSFAGVAANGRVRALFVTEDREQIARNYAAREGQPQHERAENSARHNDWLAEESARLGLPVLPARPWETGLSRALAALASGAA
jgi:2-phosphoglycerate kinase